MGIGIGMIGGGTGTGEAPFGIEERVSFPRKSVSATRVTDSLDTPASSGSCTSRNEP
jgi:hypothetical protein